MQAVVPRRLGLRVRNFSISAETDLNNVARRWTDLFRHVGDVRVSVSEHSKEGEGIVVLLKQCCKTGCLEDGKIIHANAVAVGGHTDKYVGTALINMYSRFKSLLDAREVFAVMVQRDVVTWTSLITACVDNGESLAALDLFACMDCEPNQFTYAAALKACTRLAVENESEKGLWLRKGMEVEEQLKDSGVGMDTALANALIDMYSKCGSVKKAWTVFERMAYRDVISWTCIIQGYVDSKESLVALDLFRCMDCDPDCVTFVAALKACAGLAEEKETMKMFCLHKGMSIHKQAADSGYSSNVAVASTLLDMYSKCGSTELAWNVFQNMPRRDLVTWNSLILALAERSIMTAKAAFDKIPQRNVVTWTALILGQVENGASSEAVSLFMSMDCEPDSVTFIAVLRACACVGTVSVGRYLHAWICKVGLEQGEVIATSLVDFYGKCGSMQAAERAFDYLHRPGMACWNALITGYSMLGDTSQVFSLAARLERSQGLQMDSVTFLCILRACSHAGLVEEGKRYFELMVRYGISPSLEHYTCMADMLGRASRLQEAISVVKCMPFQSDTIAWMSLLGASTIK